MKRRKTHIILGSLMLIFMGALASSAIRGLDIQCGCFTTADTGSGNLVLNIIRDIVLLGMAVAVLIQSFRPTTPAT